MVGYWFAEAPGEWQPPSSLLAFLENGESPLLVSLGAMSLGDDDALENASLFVEAIQLSSPISQINSTGANAFTSSALGCRSYHAPG